MIKIALLGTGFGQAHAAVYAGRQDVDVVVFGRDEAKLAKVAGDFDFEATTDLDSLFTDESIDLIDICLPTELHPEMIRRALASGKHALSELPLAPDLATAEDLVRLADAHPDRQVFVDMYDRFIPAHRVLLDAVDHESYGALRELDVWQATALMWPGFELGVGAIARDMMHGDLDVIVQALGAPESAHVTATSGGPARAAIEATLSYPNAIARCSGSSLMPDNYGSRGGFRATFTDAVLDSTFTQNFDGKPTASVTTYTAEGVTVTELPSGDPYAPMIDHVLACLRGEQINRIAPATVLVALDLTLHIQQEATALTNVAAHR